MRDRTINEKGKRSTGSNQLQLFIAGKNKEKKVGKKWENIY